MHVGNVKEGLQPANRLHVLRIADVVKFDIQLFDLRERAVGCEQEGIPLCSFDIDFHHERHRGVAVARELARERIEGTAVLDGTSRGNALAVKHRLPAGTRRFPKIETIVLVNANPKPARDVAPPPVIPRDSVRIAYLYVAKEIGAERIPTVVRLAETLQVAVWDPHRLDLREQFPADHVRARARCVGPCRSRAAEYSNPGQNCNNRHDNGGNPESSRTSHLASSLDQGV